MYNGCPMSRVLNGLPLLLALTGSLQPAPAIAVPFQSREDRIVEAFMTRYRVPGMAFVIMQNGMPVSHGEYGVANVKTGEKVTSKSVFPIASLSKPFVALAILSLAEQGKVKLEDPIGLYVPALPEEWKAIPLIRLLDHTAGVPDHYNSGKWNVFEQKPISSDDLIQKLVTMPLNFSPGEKYQYSNGNYVLLAKAIEKVTGKPYGQVLDEKIFKPLNMTGTKVLSLDDMPKVVQGYHTVKAGVEPVEFNPDWTFGHGAIGATSYDLARLDIGLYTEKIVKFSTLRFITTPQPLTDGSRPNYAMGWGIGHSRGAALICHDGKINGWRSFFGRFNDYNLTVIVVTNNGTPAVTTLATDLAGTVVGELALDPIADENPDLTRNDLDFVKSIRQDQVDPSWLSDGLKRDYETKDHWSAVRKLLEPGEVTLFEPAARGQSRNEFRTRYRVELGDVVRSLTIGHSAQGLVTTLLIS